LGSALIALPVAWADTGARCSGGKGHTMSYHGGHGHQSATTHLLGYLMKHKQEIGLSEEQVARLRTVALDSDRALIRAKADVQVSERELRALLWDQKAELPAIEAKVKEKESLVAEAKIIGIRSKRELIGTLTAEQKTKLKALRDQHRQNRHEMMRTEGDELTGNSQEMAGHEDGSDLGIADTGSELSAG
jgi:hypothetical protein